MKQERLKNRIVKLNLAVIMPVVLLFSTISLSLLIRQQRAGAVALLLNESYHSQLSVMEQLLGAGKAKSDKTLESVSPYLCKNLAADGAIQVLIYNRELLLLGNSSKVQTPSPSDDVTKAAEGVKAYTFFKSNGTPVISFSSPIYSGDSTVGVIRYIAPQNQSGLLNSLGKAVFGLVLLSFAVSLLLGILIAGDIVRPIERLKKLICKTGSIQESDLENIASDADFKALGKAFGMMRRSNEDAIRSMNEEKERQNLFFNNVTHQLKTPLTSIIGYSEIIKRMTEKGDVELSADYIEKAGKTLLSRVEEIIEISRLQRTDYEFEASWFQLDELCAECVNILLPRLERSGILLRNECDRLSIYYDRGRTKEVLLNLLDNCIMHSGCDEITIRTETLPLRIVIRDNGCGMSGEVLSHSFEPFYRPSKAARGGSGLGLSICKSIMTAQGGDIGIESIQDEGTSVILYFKK